MGGYLPTETPGGCDNALGVGGQQLTVGPRFVPVPVQEGPAADLDQVLIAGVVVGQERQVVTDVLLPGRPIETRAPAHIGLHTEDRFDSRLPRRLVELHSPVEDPMVGHRHRGLAIGRHRLHDLGHPRRPVQHRVLGVEMEMSEIGACAH